MPEDVQGNVKRDVLLVVVLRRCLEQRLHHRLALYYLNYRETLHRASNERKIHFP